MNPKSNPAMQAPAKVILSAAAVLAFAAFIFRQQTTQLAALQHPTSPAHVAAALTAATKPWSPPPRSPRPPPEGRLLDKLEQNLRLVFTAEQIAAFAELADEPLAGRIALHAGLSDAEQEKFRRQFAAFRLEKAKLQTAGSPARETLAEVDARRESWIAEQLGPERAAKWQAAETARLQADDEKEAATAVNKIARAVNLTAEQKDALYSKLLTKTATPAPPAGDTVPRLQINATVSSDGGIGVPNLTEEARAILTPQQLAVYEQHTAATTGSNQRMMQQMQTLLPTLISTLRELLDEKPAQ